MRLMAKLGRLILTSACAEAPAWACRVWGGFRSPSLVPSATINFFFPLSNTLGPSIGG